MIEPAALALIAGTTVLWAGSHFFGVGEIVDAILLVVGAVTVGIAVFEGAAELYKFARGAVHAQTEADLDRAGRHFARAVTILGIATIQTVLMRGAVKSALKRGMPKIQPRYKVGPPPTGGDKLRLSRPATLKNAAGDCDWYGVIRVSRAQSLTEQKLTLFHELVTASSRRARVR